MDNREKKFKVDLIVTLVAVASTLSGISMLAHPDWFPIVPIAVGLFTLAMTVVIWIR